MINRISDSNAYMQQSKSGTEHHVKTDKEFSIDYKNEEIEQNVKELPGVKVDFSTKQKIPEEVVIDYSLISEIKDRLLEIKEMLKAFWDRVWNGKHIEENASAAEEKEKMLTDMTLEEVSSYVSDNGKKRLAKNSDILTTYNQFGKIVEIDPSEKNKIFHGNKSWKEF